MGWYLQVLFGMAAVHGNKVRSDPSQKRDLSLSLSHCGCSHDQCVPEVEPSNELGIDSEQDSCFVQWKEEFTQDFLESCLKNDDPDEPVIFMLGDSHSRSVVSALRAATERKVVYFGLASLVMKSNPDFFQHVVDRLVAVLGASDVVVLQEDLTSSSGGVTIPDKDYESHLDALVKATASRGAKLVLFTDVPDVDSSITCVISGHAGRCNKTRENAFIQQLVKRKYISNCENLGHVQVFDYGEHFCSETDGCGPFIPGTKVSCYVDSSPHLSIYGSKYLSHFICELMQGIS